MAELKLLIGTPAELKAYIANTSDDADFTEYLDPHELVFERWVNKGAVTGIAGEEKDIKLFAETIPSITKGEMLYLADITEGTPRVVTRIHFGGRIYKNPKTYVSVLETGVEIQQVTIQASSFERVMSETYARNALAVNQPADRIAKAILAKNVNDDIVSTGTFDNPGRMSYVDFSNDTTVWNALLELTSFFQYFECVVEPVLSTTQAGAQVHFRKKLKSYTTFSLTSSLLQQLGPLTSNIDENEDNKANVITMPWWAEAYRPWEYFTQRTVTESYELITEATLKGRPVNIIHTDIFRELFSTADWPSGLINQGEDYLKPGNENDVYGLHFLDGTAEFSAWGDFGVVSDPELIQFEPVNLTALRAKELYVSSMGEAIICAYLDYDGVTDPDTELFDIDRIIFGLKLNADGSMSIIENGVATGIAETYEEEEFYTIRNVCEVYETRVTTLTATNDIPVDDTDIFTADDVIEIFRSGEDQAPTETVVTSVGASNIIVSAPIGSIAAGVLVRTKPKATLQINGGTHGTVSGSEWVTLGTMANTFQTTADEARDLGFCIGFQKSLVGTLKEFWASHYPPVEVYVGTDRLTCYTAEHTSEADIQCFLDVVDGLAKIRFPSDTKDLWGSGEILKVRYKEKRLNKLTLVDYQDIQQTAENRGTPIEETDRTLDSWRRKGGIEAPEEKLLETTLTSAEAYALAKQILAFRVRGDFRVWLDNFHSLEHGFIEPGMILPVNHYEYGQFEIEIQRVLATYWGPVSGETQFTYYIEANWPDTLDDLYKRLAVRRIENRGNDTATIFENVPVAEYIYHQDLVSYSQQPYVDYIIDAGQGVGDEQDIRYTIMAE
jgi:hypothetical protein